MPAFQSSLATEGEAFAENRAHQLALIEELRGLESRTEAASAKSAPRFGRRGQLLPRERLGLLLDAGAPFLQLSSLAGYLLDVADPAKSVPGGGCVVGVGRVAGTTCMIVVDDSGIEAGALQHMGLEKFQRAQQIALENRLPFVHLVESAGANLLGYRVEDFINGGSHYCRLARLSAAGIPVLTLVHGSSTAGGAYMPGLSDYVVSARPGTGISRRSAPAPCGHRRDCHRGGPRRRRHASLSLRPRRVRRRGRCRRHPHPARAGGEPRLAAGRGRAAAGTRAALPGRGSLTEASFALFYLNDDVPRDLFSLGRPADETRLAEGLIRYRVNLLDAKDVLRDHHASLNQIPTQTVLILQGGGALGAFQCGVVKAMEEVRIFHDVVAGISIGAVNGAIIAANPRNATHALEAFWKDLEVITPCLPFVEMRHAAAAAKVLTFGVPQFFKPRCCLPSMDSPMFPGIGTAITMPLR